MYLILARKVMLGGKTIRWQAHLKEQKDFLWTKEDMLREKKRLEAAGEVIKIFRVRKEN